MHGDLKSFFLGTARHELKGTTMSAKKTTNKAVDQVEVVERTDEELAAEENAPKGEIKDGVYTEKGVELTNGTKIEVGVIVDQKKLPATYGSLLAEGNGPALTIATLTTKTRRILDLSGATMEDLEEVLPAVIERGRDAADAAESK